MAPSRKVLLSILAFCWLATASAQRSFLVVSDIHLDEHDNQSAILPNARNAGIDTWDTAQHEIDHLLKTQSPRFIIYLGDLPLHVPAAVVVTAMPSAGKALTDLRTLATNYHIPLLFVPGNNDSPDSDYGKFSPAIFEYDTTGAKDWPAIGTRMLKSPLYSTLGCYAAYPLGRKAKLRVIVLNTVLYTWNYHSPNHDEECKEQLSWLGRQLAATKTNHETALIVMHVPPGVDVYKHATFWTTKVPVNGTTIQNNFLDTLARYHQNILGVLASHTHMDGFKRLYDKKGKFITLLISAPAVAPSAYNNTAVKLIRYNTNRQFTESTTFYHTTTWQRNLIRDPNQQSLKTYLANMDSTSLYQMVDTIYNTGIKAHNKALDIDVRRN
ncbi:MAG TPA: metallophosphoesterase [Puia sp.]|nr:metallophosphoesterase [Puia sp.]